MKNIARTIAALAQFDASETVSLVLVATTDEGPWRAFVACGANPSAPVFTADESLQNLCGSGAFPADALAALEVVCSSSAHLEALEGEGY